MKAKFTIRKEVWIVASLAGVMGLIAFTGRRLGNTTCQSVAVEIVNDEDNHFMDEEDVLKLVNPADHPLIGTAIDRINLKELEAKLRFDKHILRADLFFDLKGNLVAGITMRRPIARFIQEDSPDAYVSDDGTIMPVSDKFTSRVLLISGSFVKKAMPWNNLNDSDDGKAIMRILHLIQKDAFWRAQIAQMDISGDSRITMYPQVTGQLIQFGTADNMEAKFKKLMIFYKEVLPTRGWTRYEKVNVEYEGQIIAE
jgi:cell division protein FtsQ